MVFSARRSDTTTSAYFYRPVHLFRSRCRYTCCLHSGCSPIAHGFLKSFLKCIVRRLACPHRHSPSHQTILLGLHGTHVMHHLSRIIELRYNQLLVKQSDGYWIHFFSSNIPSTSCSTKGPALHSSRTLGSKHSSPCQTFSGMSAP